MKHTTRLVTGIGCASLFGVIVCRGRSTETQTPHPTMRPRSGAGAPRDLAKNRPPLLDAYGKVPLTFEPNRGQTDPRVRFLSRGSGYTVFLTSNEAVLAFGRGSDSAAVSMTLVGGNAASVASGVDELPGRSNYIVGNDPAQWRTKIPTYRKVRYHDAYPGIDLVYYGQRDQFEY